MYHYYEKRVKLQIFDKSYVEICLFCHFIIIFAIRKYINNENIYRCRYKKEIIT